MSRCCDICGREIGTYNSRYTLTYKSILYSKEKDICPLCFEKLQELFKKHKVEDESQMDYRITGTIGYKCPKCGRGNFLNNESNCVYCGEPLIKTDCAWKKGEDDV